MIAYPAFDYQFCLLIIDLRRPEVQRSGRYAHDGESAPLDAAPRTHVRSIPISQDEVNPRVLKFQLAMALRGGQMSPFKRHLAPSYLLCLLMASILTLAQKNEIGGIDAATLSMARNGDPKAELLIGFAYMRGEVTPPTPEFLPDGFAWCLRAAEAGSATAEFVVGWEYHDGFGTPTDPKLADKWFRKASAHSMGIDSSLAIQYPAWRLLPSADRHLYFWLGSLYEDGKELPQDYTQAALWFRLGAELGEDDSQSSLGSLYEEGKGVPQDYMKAVMWDRKAAEKDYSDAEYNLAVLYEQGKGVIQDFASARQWYEKAATHGVPDAYAALGFLYALGKGVDRSPGFAYAMFSVAAAEMNGDQQTKIAELRDRCATEMNEKQLYMARKDAEFLLAKFPPRRMNAP